MNNISIETGNLFDKGFRRTVYGQEVANNGVIRIDIGLTYDIYQTRQPPSKGLLIDFGQRGVMLRLGEVRSIRTYPNNPLYCVRLQSPMPALSVKKRSQRGENHFWRAFLACRLGLGLFARPHNDPAIRIGSYTETIYT